MKTELDKIPNTYLTYLDELRASGQINMFGAGQFLQVEFGLDHKKAQTILSYWRETFSDRQLTIMEALQKQLTDIMEDSRKLGFEQANNAEDVAALKKQLIEPENIE